MDTTEMEKKVVEMIQRHAEAMRPLLDKSLTLSTHLGAVTELDGAARAMTRMLPDLSPESRVGMKLAITLLQKRIAGVVREFDEDAAR